MRQDSKGAKYTQLGTATSMRDGGCLSQPGNIRDESTLRSAAGKGQDEGPSFWKDLTGIRSLVKGSEVLYTFLSLNSCNSVMQLTTPPLGESQAEPDSMETYQEFPSIILINQYFNVFNILKDHNHYRDF